MSTVQGKTLGEAQAKLVKALQEAQAPKHMIDRALEGYYDDYKSCLAAPCVTLVREARQASLHDIAERAMHGEFDGTEADSNAWAKSMENDPEVDQILKDLGLNHR